MKSLKVTIVGGGGYIGFHTGVALQKRGHRVTLLDIRGPDPFWIQQSCLWPARGRCEKCRDFVDCSRCLEILNEASPMIQFVKGSLLNFSELRGAVAGAHCVILCASYGMSGLEQMPSQWTLTELVNITGAENVLRACRLAGVSSLVYTSSFNVVFGGQEIVNGTESLPYFPLHQHVDHYSRTKAIAERLVLYSDGVQDIRQNKEATLNYIPLRTCALRLAGVVGLGERRHLPRIVSLFPLVACSFSYGDKSLQQFLTLRNVVQAHVKAAEGLTERPEVMGGQAYFISDGEPMNSFDFFGRLRDALGYSPGVCGIPIRIPMWLVWTLVYLIQLVHCVACWISPRLSFVPILAPAEVWKSARTHYFRNDKAKRDFGYEPERPNDISDVIQYYCDIKRKKKA